MNLKLTLVRLIVCIAISTSAMPAQTTSTRIDSQAVARHKSRANKSPSSIERELREMRAELQMQIDELKKELATRDATIEGLEAKAQTIEGQAASTATRVESIGTAAQQNSVSLADLDTSNTVLRTQVAAESAGVQEVQNAQEKSQKDINDPSSIHYKGITITPGGFIAAESIWRQRAMNADIYTNFNATPYMNSGEAHISEWVPSARQTRLSALMSTTVPFGTISGYVEGDFLSAGTTSNNLQTNSYTPRLRQAWAQVAIGPVRLTGGQMWTLVAENRKAADPGTEAVPLFFDGNLHVGASYTRQPGARIEGTFSPWLTLAVAIENSQYQFSATNAPSNFFFGAPGAQGGLNNQTANYTNQVSPDIIVKASLDPGYGHYEIGGIVRFFRDRYYPATTTSRGANNDTRVGGGLIANARFPVTTRLDVGFHLVAGDGTGRYGPALLPDVTVRPEGTLSPIRNLQSLFSLEAHPSKKLDIFGYAGAEYAQRTYYRDAAGALVGYAPPTASNVGCFVEAVPTSGTGFAPGAGTCTGATRDIVQGSIGWQYRLYTGPGGKLQYGAAYSYLTRNGWTGVGGNPKATNNFVYTSFRYYLP